VLPLLLVNTFATTPSTVAYSPTCAAASLAGMAGSVLARGVRLADATHSLSIATRDFATSERIDLSRSYSSLLISRSSKSAFATIRRHLAPSVPAASMVRVRADDAQMLKIEHAIFRDQSNRKRKRGLLQAFAMRRVLHRLKASSVQWRKKMVAVLSTTISVPFPRASDNPGSNLSVADIIRRFTRHEIASGKCFDRV